MKKGAWALRRKVLPAKTPARKVPEDDLCAKHLDERRFQRPCQHLQLLWLRRERRHEDHDVTQWACEDTLRTHRECHPLADAPLGREVGFAGAISDQLDSRHEASDAYVADVTMARDAFERLAQHGRLRRHLLHH